MHSMYNSEPPMLKTMRAYLETHPGANTKETADAIGCDYSYVRRMKAMHGLAVYVQPYNKLTPEEQHDILRLRKAGWKIKDIAEYYSVHWTTVWRLCKEVSQHSHRWTTENDAMLVRLIVDGNSSEQIRDLMQLRTKAQVTSRRSVLRHRYNMTWQDLLVLLTTK